MAVAIATGGNPSLSGTGRKIVRLSNGWLVASILANGFVVLYVSKNNGATWTTWGNTNNAIVSPGAITAHGTNVSLLAFVNYGTYKYATVFTVDIAKTPVENTGNSSQGSTFHSVFKTLHTAPTDALQTDIAIDPRTGHLHAVWSCRISVGQTSANVYYSKSTDQGKTWSTAAQVSNQPVGGGVIANPTITFYQGRPVITANYVSAPNYGITRYVQNDSGGWVSPNWNEIAGNSSGFIYSNPVSCTDPDGTIHVVFQGQGHSNVGTSYFVIYYSRSTNGGVTWSPLTAIASSNGVHSQSPTINIDKTGKITVLYQGVDTTVHATFMQIRKVTSTTKGLGWTNLTSVTKDTAYTSNTPQTIQDPYFAGSVTDVPPTIYVNATNTVYFDGLYKTNNDPNLTLSMPTNNQTLYENDVFNIGGTATDADNGNTVTVRYQINALTTRAIKAFLSDGSTLESFSKSLTFKGGNLYDGATLIAENLSDGVAHTLKVWATDDQGGTSAIREIPFYVVPNRAPLLTVNAPVISGNINSDKFMITGTFEDSDGNNTIVSYRLNGASSVQVAEGVNGPFEFELSFGQLVIGANEIVIEAVDSYGAKVSKTVKLNKAAVETPLLKSTVRYKINPPTGSAQAVLLWIQRDEQLDIDVSLNMTMIGEAESFIALHASNTAPIDQASSIVEDEFYYEADSAKDNIIVQIDMTRSSVEVSDAIHLISGVLE